MNWVQRGRKKCEGGQGEGEGGQEDGVGGQEEGVGGDCVVGHEGVERIKIGT